MSVILSSFAGAGAQFFDNSGNLLSGGVIYTYAAGTTTPQATYTTSTGSIAQSNPIVLDSSGRISGGELWVTTGVLYKFVLQNSSGSTIATYDNLDGINDFSTLVTSAALAASNGSSLVGYLPAGSGAVATTVQTKLRQTVSVLDFGADPTGSADSTTAFTNAQGSGQVQVYIPPGTYLLNGLNLLDGVSLIGAGKNAVRINQKLAGTPAINVITNATVNPHQIKNAQLSGFTVWGATSPTVAAVYMEATTPYAIWNSTFDYCAQNTYSALSMETNAIVFQCKFTIQSENTLGTAVKTVAEYSLFDLFLTQCNGMALEDSNFNNTYTRLISDGAYSSSGHGTVFINPVTEYFWASTIPQNCWFLLTGFAQTIIKPTLTLDATQSAKVNACIKPFAGSLIINPDFICNVANPFASSTQKWSVIGPGISNCTNKIETIYTGASSSLSMANVSLIGDCSSFSSTPTERNTSQIQYLAPSGSFNFQINPNTGTIIWEPSGTIALANMSLLGSFVPVDGQQWTITTTQTITSISWSGMTTGTTTLLPTTLAANSRFSFIYNATQNKYYLV